MNVLLPDQLAYHSYIIQAAALASAEHFYLQNGGKRAATRQGKSARKRIRQSVEEIYHCLGPVYFCRAYRMHYVSFWRLHDLLEVKIEEAAATTRGYLPKEMHSVISLSVSEKHMVLW